MLSLPREDRQIARLFDFLLQGEQLAFDCASRQLSLFHDKATRNFLHTQARQEKFHCRVFKSGIGILAPKGVSASPGRQAMQAYRGLLEEALRRGDRAETLLGMQVFLEGLGDVTLRHVGAGFEHRQLEFLCRRVRHLVSNQEHAHHTFGVRRLQLLLRDEDLSARLGERSQDYLELLEQLLASVTDLFEFFDEDPERYLREFRQDLPDWLGAPAI